MSTPRFEELYERYCDGELDDGEQGEFLVQLEDPACRARFAQIATLEAAVSEELRLVEETPAEPKPSSRLLLRVASRRIPPRRLAPADETRALRMVGLAAAAAVLAVLVVVFATSSKGGAAGPQVVRPNLEPPSEVQAPGAVPVPIAIQPPLPALVEAKRVEERGTPREFVPVPVPQEAPVAPFNPAPVKPVAPPSVKPQDPAPRESAIFVATLEQVSGDVRLGNESGEAGKGIGSGQAVATGKGGYASLRFPDGSRLELGGETAVSRLLDGLGGKSAQLEQGIIFVDAAKQPAGRPWVITTLQAESTVLGTQFVLAATPVYTRIDVREGRVKFTRLPQAVSSVMVNAGHYAIAGPGGELAARAGIVLWKAPPAGLQLWLRADVGVKLNGTTVAQWADQSTAGNAAVQASASAQPALITNALGGRPALRFDGIAGHFTLPDGFGDFRLGLTAFVVLRPSPGAAGSRFIDLDVGPTCDNIVFGRKDTSDKLGFWVFSNSLSRGKVEVPGAVIAEQVQSFSALLSPGGHVTLYRNGSVVGTGDTSVPRSVVRKPNLLFKSTSGETDSLFKGDLFEILLYNRALSDAERMFVESYFYNKYFDPTFPPVLSRPAEK